MNFSLIHISHHVYILFNCLLQPWASQEAGENFSFFLPHENESTDDKFTRERKPARRAIHGQGLVGCLQADRESYTISYNAFFFRSPHYALFSLNVNMHSLMIFAGF